VAVHRQQHPDHQPGGPARPLHRHRLRRRGGGCGTVWKIAC